MARISAILIALARLVAREQRRFNSIGGNNLLWVLYFLQAGGLFIMVLAAAALLVPLSTSPVSKIPADRRRLWPLTPADWWAVRAGGFALTPAAWIAAALLWFSKGGSAALQLAGVAAAMQAVKRFLDRTPSINLLRWIPPLPGTLGQLVRKNIREMLSVLDTWIAAMLAASAIAFRILRPGVATDFQPMVSMLVVTILSTFAQCLFGLEAKSGFTRYRMLPLSGWRILFAKDAAFLGIAALLTAGIDPLSGMAAAFAALAVGHHHSIRQTAPQAKWGFMSGSLIPAGLTQVIAMFGASNLARQDLAFLGIAIAAWAVSLAFYGWWWSRGEDE